MFPPITFSVFTSSLPFQFWFSSTALLLLPRAGCFHAGLQVWLNFYFKNYRVYKILIFNFFFACVQITGISVYSSTETNIKCEQWKTSSKYEICIAAAELCFVMWQFASWGTVVIFALQTQRFYFRNLQIHFFNLFKHPRHNLKLFPLNLFSSSQPLSHLKVKKNPDSELGVPLHLVIVPAIQSNF